MAVTADFEAYLAGDWYGRPMTVAALLECEAEAGIDMAVVMPDAREDPDNDGLLERTAGHPNLLPCVMMNPHLGAEGVAQLRSYVSRGAKGMKLMGAIHKFEVDDPMVYPFADAAQELGIVVSIHTGVQKLQRGPGSSDRRTRSRLRGYPGSHGFSRPFRRRDGGVPEIRKRVHGHDRPAVSQAVGG